MFTSLILEMNTFLHCDLCSEADEIYKICGVIGNPTAESWADGLKLARDINYQFPQVSIICMGSLFLVVSFYYGFYLK